MKLNELRDNSGASKARLRVGRGSSSGKGKTAGRGVKGQKSRSGVAIKGFEGGQMPIHMRLPKRGFNKPNRLKLNGVNLGRLQQALDAGKLDAKTVVTVQSLRAAGVVRRELDGVRILANGELKTKLNFEVAGISKAAMEIVEKLGGTVKVLKRKIVAGSEEASKASAAKKAAKKAAPVAKKAPVAKAAPVKEDAKKAAPAKEAAKEATKDAPAKEATKDAPAKEAPAAKEVTKETPASETPASETPASEKDD